MANVFTYTIKVVDEGSATMQSFAKNANQSVDDVGKSAGSSTGKIGGLGTALGTFAGVAGGLVAGGALQAIGGFFKDAATGAADDAASTARLQQAIENVAGAFDPYAQQVDDAIKRGQDLAFTDDQTRDALSLLIAETGSAEEGMARLSAAQDLSRGTGMDLVTAAKLLGKVTDENVGVLGRYGIVVKEGASAQDLLNEVDARFGGQAATFAETDAGKMAHMSDKVGELQEQLGAYLIPILGLVVGAVVAVIDASSRWLGLLSPLIGFIKDNLTPALIAITPLILGLGVAILAALVPALIAQAAATWAAVAPFLPLIAVMLAVGAAVALLYLAWQSNLLGIQDITKAVLDFLGPYVISVIDGIRAGAEAVLGALRTAWETFWPILQAVVDAVLPVIVGAVTLYIGAILAVVQTTLGLIQAAWDFLWPYLQTVIERVLPIVRDAVATYIDGARLIIVTALGVIQEIWDRVWPLVQATVERVLPIIHTVVANNIEAARLAIELGMAAIQEIWDRVWPLIQTTAEVVWAAILVAVQVITAVRDLISTVMGEIQGPWDTAWGAIKSTVEDVWSGVNGIVRLVDGGISSVKTVLEAVYEPLLTGWNGLWDSISGKVSAVTDAIAGFVSTIKDTINGLIRGWNALSFNFPGTPAVGPIPGIPGFTVETPNVPELARGGLTTGEMYAKIHANEAVIPLNDPRAMRALGNAVQQPGMPGAGSGHGHNVNQPPGLPTARPVLLPGGPLAPEPGINIANPPDRVVGINEVVGPSKGTPGINDVVGPIEVTPVNPDGTPLTGPAQQVMTGGGTDFGASLVDWDNVQGVALESLSRTLQAILIEAWGLAVPVWLQHARQVRETGSGAGMFESETGVRLIVNAINTLSHLRPQLYVDSEEVSVHVRRGLVRDLPKSVARS